MILQAFKITIDTREQLPWEFGPDVETTGGTLASGDYSIEGLQHLVAIERKSLPDLVACVGPERERFERELHRLQAYRVAAVVIEATLADVLAGNYRSQTSPAAVLGSVAAWGQRYKLPFIFAGNPDGAAHWTLATFKAFWRDLVRLAESLGLGKQ